MRPLGQPDIPIYDYWYSRIVRGSSGAYSVERLMEFLTALGHDVEVVITPTRKKQGAMSVVVAA